MMYMFRTDAQPLPGYLTGWPVAQPDDPLSNWAGTAALACMAPVAPTIRQRLRKAATTPDYYHHHANLI